MPLTFDEIDAMLSLRTKLVFLEEAGLTVEDWRGFFVAIPEDWAKSLEKHVGIPLSAWPRIVPHPRGSLHQRKKVVNVFGPDMDIKQRIAISKGQRTTDGAFHEKIRGAKPKPFTMSGLARKVGMSPTMLSLCRSGARRCPTTKAKKIQELTGWTASEANWPGGLSDG